MSPWGYLAEPGCRPPKPLRDLGLLLHVAFCPAVRGGLEPDTVNLRVLVKEGTPSGVTLKGAQSLTGRWKGSEEGEGRTAGHVPAGGRISLCRTQTVPDTGQRTRSTRFAWLSWGALPVRASRGGRGESPGGPALLSTPFVLSRLDRHVLMTEQPQRSRNRRGLRRPRLCGDTVPLFFLSLG